MSNSTESNPTNLTSEESLSPTNTHNGPPSDLVRLLLSNETPGCTCKKSRCLKLYCQCFAVSALCDSKCKCASCKNILEREKDIARARSNVLYRNPRAFENKFSHGGFNKPVRKLPSIHRGFQDMQRVGSVVGVSGVGHMNGESICLKECEGLCCYGMETLYVSFLLYFFL